MSSSGERRAPNRKSRAGECAICGGGHASSAGNYRNHTESKNSKNGHLYPYVKLQL